jgi:hypothetical protein
MEKEEKGEERVDKIGLFFFFFVIKKKMRKLVNIG